MSGIIIGVNNSETGSSIQRRAIESSTSTPSEFVPNNMEIILATISDVGSLKQSVELLQKEVKKTKPIHKKQGQFINALITSGIIAFILVMLLLIAQCFIFLFFLTKYYPNGFPTLVMNWVMTGISIATLLELVYAIGYTKTARNAYLDLSSRVAQLEEEANKTNHD